MALPGEGINAPSSEGDSDATNEGEASATQTRQEHVAPMVSLVTSTYVAPAFPPTDTRPATPHSGSHI